MVIRFKLGPEDVAEVEAAFSEGAAAYSRIVRGYESGLNADGSKRSARQVLAFVHGSTRDSEPSPKVPRVGPGFNPWLAWAVDRARAAGEEWSTIAFIGLQFGAGASPEEMLRGTDREELKQKSRTRKGRKGGV